MALWLILYNRIRLVGLHPYPRYEIIQSHSISFTEIENTNPVPAVHAFVKQNIFLQRLTTPNCSAGNNISFQCFRSDIQIIASLQKKNSL